MCMPNSPKDVFDTLGAFILAPNIKGIMQGQSLHEIIFNYFQKFYCRERNLLDDLEYQIFQKTQFVLRAQIEIYF